MFVDASAIVAILTREAEADRFVAVLANAAGAITSPLAIFEATLGIVRKHRISVTEASEVVADFLIQADIAVHPVGAAEGWLALQAFARFGRGTGHPARLNFGDCFSYAVARARGTDLLFKGEDFAATDIAAAVMS